MQILGEYRDSTSVFLCMLWSISWFQFWTVNARLSGECSVSSLFCDRVFLQWIGIVVNSVFAAKLHHLFVHFPFVSGTSATLFFFFCCERRPFYGSLNNAGQGFSRFELPIRGALHPLTTSVVSSLSQRVCLSVCLAVRLSLHGVLSEDRRFEEVAILIRWPSVPGLCVFSPPSLFLVVYFWIASGDFCWVVAESISFLWEIGTRNQEPGP